MNDTAGAIIYKISGVNHGSGERPTGAVYGKDYVVIVFFFSSRRRHTRLQGDWSSDVCSSDLSLKVLRIAAVDCDCTRRSAMRARRRDIGTRCSGRPERSWSTFTGAGTGVKEIGRASCRERV